MTLEIDFTSPDTILDSARIMHVEGDRLLKSGKFDEGNVIHVTAERAYNNLINNQFKQGFVLTLLAAMDQRRDCNGRAIWLAQASIAHLKEWLSISENKDDRKNIEKHCIIASAHRAEGRRDISLKYFEYALEWGNNDPAILSGYAGLFINDGNPKRKNRHTNFNIISPFCPT